MRWRFTNITVKTSASAYVSNEDKKDFYPSTERKFKKPKQNLLIVIDLNAKDGTDNIYMKE